MRKVFGVVLEIVLLAWGIWWFATVPPYALLKTYLVFAAILGFVLGKMATEEGMDFADGQHLILMAIAWPVFLPFAAGLGLGTKAKKPATVIPMVISREQSKLTH